MNNLDKWLMNSRVGILYEGSLKFSANKKVFENYYILNWY